jgi:hypothetical protein
MNSTTEKETYLAPFADAVLMVSQQIICSSEKKFTTGVEPLSEQTYPWGI